MSSDFTDVFTADYRCGFSDCTFEFTAGVDQRACISTTPITGSGTAYSSFNTNSCTAFGTGTYRWRCGVSPYQGVSNTWTVEFKCYDATLTTIPAWTTAIPSVAGLTTALLYHGDSYATAVSSEVECPLTYTLTESTTLLSFTAPALYYNQNVRA